MVFALELMGGKNVRAYYRGWQEWSTAASSPFAPEAKKK
jgi:3-mercaptopyruvate sulfurtransferase SseA